MYEEKEKLIEKIRSGKINCCYANCSACPYRVHDDYCHEYKLADCCKLLLSDISREHPIIELIKDILAIY